MEKTDYTPSYIHGCLFLSRFVTHMTVPLIAGSMQLQSSCTESIEIDDGLRPPWIGSFSSKEDGTKV